MPALAVMVTRFLAAASSALWLGRIVRQRWADGLLIVLWLVQPAAIGSQLFRARSG